MPGTRRNVKHVDIAREAGVANSVVSALFSGNYYEKRRSAAVGIGKETRKRIWEACRRLNYRPMNSVLFMEIYPEEADIVFLLNKVTGGFANDFFSLILDGLSDRAEGLDVNLVLGWFESGIDYWSSRASLPQPVKNHPTGKFVLAGTPNLSLIRALLREGAKVLYVGRRVDLDSVISLVPDYRAAARLAITRLIELGHREIEVIAASYFLRDAYNTCEFVAGCAEAFRLVDRTFTGDDLLYPDSPKQAEFEAKVRSQTADAPTAAFFLDDATAVLFQRKVLDWGLRLPEQFSMIGCNDQKMTATVEPRLSTVRFPMREVGHRAFDRITQAAVEGCPEGAELEVWPVELVERHSVAARGGSR